MEKQELHSEMAIDNLSVWDFWCTDRRNLIIGKQWWDGAPGVAKLGIPKLSWEVFSVSSG